MSKMSLNMSKCFEMSRVVANFPKLYQTISKCTEMSQKISLDLDYYPKIEKIGKNTQLTLFCLAYFIMHLAEFSCSELVYLGAGLPPQSPKRQKSKLSPSTVSSILYVGRSLKLPVGSIFFPKESAKKLAKIFIFKNSQKMA